MIKKYFNYILYTQLAVAAVIGYLIVAALAAGALALAFLVVSVV